VVREPAALADLDQRRAGEDHVIGEVRAGPDHDLAVAVDLAAEVAAELNAVADDERAVVRDVQAEPGAQVDASSEPDRGMWMPEQDPLLADLRHEAGTPPVANPDRRVTQAAQPSAYEPRNDVSVPHTRG